MVDQGLNSLSNVAATLLVAHSGSGRAFAVFATGQLVLALGQTVMLAAAGDKLLQGATDQRPGRYAAALGVYRAVVVLGGVLAAVAFTSDAAGPYLMAGAALTAVVGLDYVRTALFAARRFVTALVADSVFAVLQLGGIVVWSVAGAPGGVVGAWSVWALSAVVVVLPFLLGRVRPLPAAARARVKDSVSLRYGAEMTVVNGSGQIAQLVASAVVGLAFNGLIRGTQLPFGAVVVVMLAARSVLIPLFAQHADAARALWLKATAALVALAVLCGAVTGAVASVPALRVLIAGQDPGWVFIALVTATYAAVTVQTTTFYLLRARHDDRAVGISRAVVVAGFVVAAVLAGLTRSGEAFLAASAVTWTAAAVVMLVCARRGASAPAPAEAPDAVAAAEVVATVDPDVPAAPVVPAGRPFGRVEAAL